VLLTFASERVCEKQTSQSDRGNENGKRTQHHDGRAMREDDDDVRYIGTIHINNNSNNNNNNSKAL